MRATSVVLPRVGDGYALHADVDVSRFRELVGKARGGAAQVVATTLAEALDLWHGPPLADVPVLAAQHRLAGLLAEKRQALARFAEAMIEVGRAAEVLALLTEEAATHPLDEAMQARLARAHQAAGHRAKALEVYESARRALAEQLGVDPGPELAAAHRALLRDPVHPPPTAPARAVPRQLPADPPRFTGRAAELRQLDRLRADGVALCVIVGAAGVGKPHPGN